MFTIEIYAQFSFVKHLFILPTITSLELKTKKKFETPISDEMAEGFFQFNIDLF